MAKSTKNRTPMSAGSKGIICLAVLLALTVFVSWLSVFGLSWGDNGMNTLLPWVPVSSENWPQSLPLNRALGGGNAYDYTAALPEGSEGDLSQETADAVQVIRQRLSKMNEADAAVSEKDGTVRIELRSMDASRLSSVLSMAVMPGQFEFTSGGTAILTEEDIADAQLSLNSARNGYNLVLKTTAEGAEKLANSGASYVAITCDGESISTYASVSGDTITATMGSTQNGYNTGVNMAFLLDTGAVDVNLTQGAATPVDATSASVKTIFLIAAAILLVCGLVYLLVSGKLTGLSGFLTVWCAVVLTMFFVATIVVPSASVIALTVGCLVAILLGLLLALYTAVARTDAVAAQIKEGSTPKQAVKFGFRAAAKNVWIVHGAVLLIALILMIFPFSRAAGYALAAGVAGSAITACLMRAFLGCFTAITGKASLFGKK